MLKVGSAAPEFEGADQHGKPFRLSDLRGRWVVLYFYPRDETLGCTQEACAFRDNMASFVSLDAEVVGVSVQDSESHRGFAAHHNLSFRLIADPEKTISRLFDTLGLLGVAKRVTYLIDSDGKLADVYRSEIDPTSHVAHARERLHALGAAVRP